MKLKEILKEYCENFEQSTTKENVVSYAWNKSKQVYSKRYIKIFLEKVIVNNPSRVKMGSPADFFIQEKDFLIPYKGQKIEKFYFNKELSVKRNDKEFDLKINLLPLESPVTRNKILIITNCSKSKKDGKLKAIDKYDSLGIDFLRKLENCDIYIFSAFYGLVYSQTEIENYDQTLVGLSKLDLKKAGELLHIRESIESIINEYEKIYFVMSNSYLRAINIHKIPFSKSGKNLTIFYEKNEMDTVMNFENTIINIDRESNSSAEIFKKAKACYEIIKGS